MNIVLDTNAVLYLLGGRLADDFNEPLDDLKDYMW